MSRARAIAIACAALLAASSATHALADTPPNGWDIARDPASADRWALHLQVRRFMANVLDERLTPRRIGLVRARLLLEQAHAADSPDVRLRFDLGKVYETLEEYPQAIAVLEPAIAMAPDDPAALDAYVDLANAYAKLDDSRDERRTYERYLPRVIDERRRVTAVLNMAEADMHLGDLGAAIAGYRQAIEAAAQLPNVVELELNTGTLAHWGLAVALDRSGDVAGGAKEARFVLQLDHDMLIIRASPNVFFSPQRERAWYVALGYAEYAKLASDARAAAFFWHRSEGCWRQYIDDVSAHAAYDQWVAVARARLEKAHASRVAAERRASKPLVYKDEPCFPTDAY